jgi:hypothetical protein
VENDIVNDKIKENDDGETRSPEDVDLIINP